MEDALHVSTYTGSLSSALDEVQLDRQNSPVFETSASYVATEQFGVNSRTRLPNRSHLFAEFLKGVALFLVVFLFEWKDLRSTCIGMTAEDALTNSGLVPRRLAPCEFLENRSFARLVRRVRFGPEPVKCDLGECAACGTWRTHGLIQRAAPSTTRRLSDDGSPPAAREYPSLLHQFCDIVLSVESHIGFHAAEVAEDGGSSSAGRATPDECGTTQGVPSEASGELVAAPTETPPNPHLQQLPQADSEQGVERRAVKRKFTDPSEGGADPRSESSAPHKVSLLQPEEPSTSSSSIPSSLDSSCVPAVSGPSQHEEDEAIPSTSAGASKVEPSKKAPSQRRPRLFFEKEELSALLGTLHNVPVLLLPSLASPEFLLQGWGITREDIGSYGYVVDSVITLRYAMQLLARPFLTADSTANLAFAAKQCLHEFVNLDVLAHSGLQHMRSARSALPKIASCYLRLDVLLRIANCLPHLLRRENWWNMVFEKMNISRAVLVKRKYTTEHSLLLHRYRIAILRLKEGSRLNPLAVKCLTKGALDRSYLFGALQEELSIWQVT